VKNIYVEGIVFDSQIRAGNYDLLIVTPGPTVNELQHCITAYKAPKGVIIPPEQ
jgi:hypothetical protein